MKPQSNSQFTDFKEKAEKKLEVVKDKVVETGKEVAHKVDHEAHKRPWLFVAIGSVFAAFFGFFLGKKFKK
jgi:ElaB/YqjD/DUF883 family membrane-anchored ribosome-binding protein